MTVSVGIIGSGKAGANLAAAFTACPRSRVEVVMSRTGENARRLAKMYNIERHTDKFDDVLADNKIDAVAIASPDKFHCQQAIEAAKAGKHILCEKPMCRTEDEAKAMMQAAESANVTLMIGFSERFNQPCLEAKARIDRGEIGEPVMILARRCHPISTVRGRDWLTDSDTGGVLSYAGTHNIDLICWFMGSNPERVYGETARLVLEEQLFTDSAVVTFRFPGGKMAVLYESFAYPDPYPHGVDRSIEILGKKGCLNIDFMRQPLNIYSSAGYTIGDAVTWPRTDGQIGGALLNEVRHFVDAIIEKKAVLTPGETGLNAIKIAVAAKKAALSGKAEYISWEMKYT